MGFHISPVQTPLFTVYKMLYFDEINIKRLKKVCQEWDGIKYRHMGNNSGGIDCTKLIGVILVKLDILKRYDESVYYSKDWFFHSQKELVMESFITHSKYLSYGLTFQKFRVETNFEYKDGDIILFTIGQTKHINHTGIYINKRIFHADARKGVSYIQFLRYFQARAKYVYRIFKSNI